MGQSLYLTFLFHKVKSLILIKLDIFEAYPDKLLLMNRQN